MPACCSACTAIEPPIGTVRTLGVPWRESPAADVVNSMWMVFSPHSPTPFCSPSVAETPCPSPPTSRCCVRYSPRRPGAR
jgi:hypothetical protein